MEVRNKRRVQIILSAALLILLTGLGTVWTSAEGEDYIPTCALYTVAQMPDHRSQLLAIDLRDPLSYPLGDEWQAEVQALAVHPETGVLYAITDRQGLKPGMLYTVDRTTGERAAIGPHGFKTVTALSFRWSDASLWGWSDLDGLVQLDTTTGAGTLALASNEKFSGMAWSSDSSVLYLMDKSRLWSYHDGDTEFAFVAGNLPLGAAGIEVRPDGLLVGIAGKYEPETAGEMDAHPLDQVRIFIYNPLTQELISETAVPTPRQFPGIAGLAWSRKCGNPSPGGMAEIIQSIILDKTELCPGEDLLVSVEFAHPENPQGVVDVSINGNWGNPQYLQFLGAPGPRLIGVTAATPEKFTDYEEATVELLDCGSEHEYLELYVRPNRFHQFTVDFEVANGADFKLQAPIYNWDFGDGATAQTSVPYIAHYYEGSLDYDQTLTQFQASVTLVRLNHPILTANQTVTLWSLYAFNRNRGELQLPVETDGVLTPYTWTWDGTYDIKNPEREPVYLDWRQITYQMCDPDASPIVKPPETVAYTVNAGDVLNRYLAVPIIEITSDMCGLQLDLGGQSQSGLQAYASAYFSLGRNALMTQLVTDVDMQALLNQVADDGLVADPLHISEEELYTLTRQGQISYPLQTASAQQTASTLQTVSFAQSSQYDACDMSICIPDANNQNKCVNQPCMPGDTPPRAGLSCQTTEDWCTAPPYIANARKGDVLLSAQCGMIASLLRQVSPPQYHSHAGIMTRDYYQVRHSTASSELLEAHIDGDGFQNNYLLYAWPGVITQDIGAAFNGQMWHGPDGEWYPIYGFNSDPVLCQDDVDLTWPVVVKPPPGSPQSVRAKLQQAADIAKNVGGHYRFYAYSNAAIGLDPNYYAPPVGWYMNTGPTVCSQFVWRSLVAAGATLEGEPDEEEFDDGGYMDSETLDGLYVYEEAERKVAGEWLYSELYNTVYNIAGWLGDLLTDAADNTANQFANCFANDGCTTDSKDSEAWKEPGIGRAVSPDNILLWDAPDTGGVYGHNEYLVYRGGEYIHKTTWQPSEGNGIIYGHVYDQNGDPVVDASVTIAGVELTSQAASGLFTDGWFTDPWIPAGTYDITASKQIGGYYMSVTESVVIQADQMTEIDLTLEPPPQYVRRVTISGTVDIFNDNTWPEDDVFASYSVYGSATLDIFDRDAPIIITPDCVGDEVRLELRFNLHLSEIDDMSVFINQALVIDDDGDSYWGHGFLFEGTDCATQDLEMVGRWYGTSVGIDPLVPPAPATLPFGEMYLDNDGTDWATINITVTNEEATFP